MPKDWESHKAEIRRLYIAEDRTLHEVRQVLAVNRGFKACTRAYRMKCDEWGLRKYKSRRETSQTSVKSPKSAVQHKSESGDSHSNALVPTANLSGGIRESGTFTEFSNDDHTVSDLVDFAEATPDSLYVLEMLFMNWQPTDEYISTITTYFKDPEFHKWQSFSCNGKPSAAPAVFSMIDDCILDRTQRLQLSKCILEADLLTRQPSNTDKYYTPWQEAWYHACDNKDWEEAKELLYEDGVLSLAGTVFLGCAPIVLAERLLRHHIEQIDRFKYPTVEQKVYNDSRWLDCWFKSQGEGPDTYSSEFPGDFGDPVVTREHGEQYLNIMNDFLSSGFVVCESFYRYALQIITWMERKDGDSQSGLVKQAEAHRRRYVEAISRNFVAEDQWLILGLPQSEFLDAVDHTNGKANQGSIVVQSLSAIQDIDIQELAVENEVSQYQTRLVPHVDTYKAYKILMEKRSCLAGFDEYVRSMLNRDGNGIYIFECSPINGENLFNIIVDELQPQDRIPFAKSLLSLFAASAPKADSVDWILKWHDLLRPPALWTKLQEALDDRKLRENLEERMNPAAVKLALESTVVLVGEQLLQDLKEKMVACRQSTAIGNFQPVPNDYERFRRQYMEVLGALQDRKLMVDQTWLAYLFNSI